MTYVYTYIINFFTKFNISWSRTKKFESFYKNILIENINDSIVKIPMFFSKYLDWRLLKKRNFRLKKKVGKWSYLNFRRATCP